MTLLYVALSVVPIIQVESRLIFAVKIGGLIVLTNVIGIAIFGAVAKKRRANYATAEASVVAE
jgi:hypothetical protein